MDTYDLYSYGCLFCCRAYEKVIRWIIFGREGQAEYLEFGLKQEKDIPR